MKTSDKHNTDYTIHFVTLITTHKRYQCQMWYQQLSPVPEYWTKCRQGSFQFQDFWSNPVKTKIDRTPEPVMIL